MNKKFHFAYLLCNLFYRFKGRLSYSNYSPILLTLFATISVSSLSAPKLKLKIEPFPPPAPMADIKTPLQF